MPFHGVELDHAVDWLLRDSSRVSESATGTSVRLANAYCVAVANTDEAYGKLLRESGVNFPDGTPVWAVMNMKARLKRPDTAVDRVRGPSFFRECLDKGRSHDVSHYFLGGTSDTINIMVGEVERQYPGIHIAGYHAPPFGPVDAAFIAAESQRILAAKPDIVWVGLGTPKQDFATTMLARETGVNCVGVGAAFDFVAGCQPEAPKFFQKSGTEWIFRFATEPKRLWRRYTFGNFRFVHAVFVDIFRDSNLLGRLREK
ncbi:N-acetylglucosaminyldiphosphoundecaprenol N-acetyl-beta-D-mannosaminyltransferase [Paenarthrobacter nitroguajacolicus]|nr:N-acetylglucosaminyldiphosphoundecaprenol N-acetyl-beta-D-mannosaminyltransferase [Paenarthrobacter nitroguajacolicus]